MFHGKPPSPDDARPLGEVQDDGCSLRELTWADLVARLKYSQGRRGIADCAEEGFDASFDATCARRIAAHLNGKHGVYHEISSNGKEAGGTGAEEMRGVGRESAPGLRGSQ